MTLRNATIIGSCIFVVLGVIYSLLAMSGIAPTLHTCISEIKKRAVQGDFEFEIARTDCSIFGETSSMSVFASKIGSPKKALLLKYDPVEISELPSIEMSAGGEIAVSVPWVSYVYSEVDTWNGMAVHYNIGRIDYPNPKVGSRGKDD